MGEKKGASLRKNFVMNAILTISNLIFPLISYYYVSRIIFKEGTGKVALATSVISYFLIFAQLGIPTYGIRESAKVRDNKLKLSKLTAELLSINLITTLITYLAFFIALFTVPRLAEDKPLFAIASVAIFFNVLGMEWLYKGLEKYTYITVRSVIFKAIAVVMMLLLIKEKEDYRIYCAITVFASSASFLLNFINARKIVTFKGLGKIDLKQHIRPVMIFLAMAAAATVYTHLDTVMLGFMKTDADVGLYDASVKIKTLLVGVVTSLGAVLLPRSTYYLQNGLKEEFINISRKAMEFVLVASFPISVYFILFAKNGILAVAGEDYVNATLPMMVIMPTVILIGMSNLIGIQMLVPMGKDKAVLYSELIGMGIDVVINIILIPRFAATGAAIGTLAAEIAVTIYQCIVLRKDVKGIFRRCRLHSVLLGTIAAGIAAFAVKNLDLGNFTSLVISAVIFFGIYCIVLILTREPLAVELIGELESKMEKRHTNMLK
ncbi:MAG: flippase [Saccharofermentans sp.]|nr:flippase [Saccharofermentans sp.]